MSNQKLTDDDRAEMVKQLTETVMIIQQGYIDQGGVEVKEFLLTVIAALVCVAGLIARDNAEIGPDSFMELAKATCEDVWGATPRN